LNAEGWKLHVTASPLDAATIAGLVLPELTQLGVPHKYLHPFKLSQKKKGKDVGKFIAIYPRSAGEAHRIEALLYSDLYGHTGPAVPGEKAFGLTGMIFVRYGSFVDEFILGPPGTNTKSLDSARGYRKYHQGTVRPSWIKDLDTDFDPTPFPNYNPRTIKLKLRKESDEVWVN
jgi:hypothetical protein